MAWSELKVRVRLFAQLRELAGTSVVEVEVEEGCSLKELLARLLELMPDVFKMAVRPDGGLVEGYSVLVDAERVGLDEVLSHGCEVAVLPPVGGGFEVVWVG